MPKATLKEKRLTETAPTPETTANPSLPPQGLYLQTQGASEIKLVGPPFPASANGVSISPTTGKQNSAPGVWKTVTSAGPGSALPGTQPMEILEKGHPLIRPVEAFLLRTPSSSIYVPLPPVLTFEDLGNKSKSVWPTSFGSSYNFYCVVSGRTLLSQRNNDYQHILSTDGPGTSLSPQKRHCCYPHFTAPGDKASSQRPCCSAFMLSPPHTHFPFSGNSRWLLFVSKSSRQPHAWGKAPGVGPL